jgi:hypothetical protein
MRGHNTFAMMMSQKCLAIFLVSTILGQISAVSIGNAEDPHSITISKENHAFEDDSCYPPIQVVQLKPLNVITG